MPFGVLISGLRPIPIFAQGANAGVVTGQAVFEAIVVRGK